MQQLTCQKVCLYFLFSFILFLFLLSPLVLRKFPGETSLKMRKFLDECDKVKKCNNDFAVELLPFNVSLIQTPPLRACLYCFARAFWDAPCPRQGPESPIPGNARQKSPFSLCSLVEAWTFLTEDSLFQAEGKWGCLDTETLFSRTCGFGTCRGSYISGTCETLQTNPPKNQKKTHTHTHKTKKRPPQTNKKLHAVKNVFLTLLKNSLKPKNSRKHYIT